MAAVARSRRVKLLCTIGFAAIAAFMVFPGFFGTRVMGDEANLSLDIFTLMAEGQVSDFVYQSGQAYITFVPLFLKVLGLPMAATNTLGPFVAAVAFTTMMAFLLSIYSGESNSLWGFVAIPFGVFVFGGFIAVLTETTHKTFIYTLVFALLFLLWRYYTNRHDRRDIVLFVVFLTSISFFSILWGMMYWLVFTVPVFLRAGNRGTIQVMYLVPGLAIYAIGTYMPTVRSPMAYVAARVFTPSTRTASSGGASLFAGWPTVSILGQSVSSWFLYASGVLLIGVITGLSFVLASHKLYRQRGNASFSNVLVLLLPLFGVVLVFFLALGELATVRRLLVFPGVLGLLYWQGYLDTASRTLGAVDVGKMLVTVTVILFCIMAVAAIPRMTLDGHNKPYDNYADDGDIARAGWIAEYPSGDCLLTTERIDRNTALKVYGYHLTYGQVGSIIAGKSENVVYANSKEGFVYCRGSNR